MVVQFGKSFNMLRAYFGAIDSEMQCLLFNKLCFIFYGVPLWRNDGASLIQGCVAWRKALIRM